MDSIYTNFINDRNKTIILDIIKTLLPKSVDWSIFLEHWTWLVREEGGVEECIQAIKRGGRLPLLLARHRKEILMAYNFEGNIQGIESMIEGAEAQLMPVYVERLERIFVMSS